MWVRLRFNGVFHQINELKKTSTVRDLKKEIEKVTELKRAEQRLLYRGKQLDIDAYSLHDYDVDNNVIIDCTKKYVAVEDLKPKEKTTKDETDKENASGNGADVKKETDAVAEGSVNSADDASTASTSAEDKVKLEDIFDGDVKELGDVEVPGEEPPCKICKSDPIVEKCKECGCQICGYKDRADVMLMCDECDYYYHMDCLDPPLESIPDGDWYCPDCKNNEDEVVQAGQLLKYNKKKAKAPSATCKKKWGGGMATAGRQKSCTKVPSNHFGPIPGIDVGMTWKYRLQLSEEGVHRPPVAGIAGKPTEGAYSIVLAGGYEDDTDNGDDFYYTGAGGRDLSGNKRTSCQSFDQTLEKTNLAIAVSCAAKLDSEDGAEAKDWKKGKPIRVVRTEKLGKHSKYAPAEGCRYDGIYKVVKYWPQKGQAGFIIWRYWFKRDDETPAPWTEEGKKLIEDNGYTCIYPPGYHEAQKAKALKKLEEEAKKGKGKGKGKGRGKKRKADADDEVEDNETDAKVEEADVVKIEEDVETSEPTSKKAKKVYPIPEAFKELMTADESNERLWQAVLETEMATKLDFTNAVEEQFMCTTCQELPDKPVTTACKHNVCLACLQRAFKADYKSCPSCRADLQDEPQEPNEKLQAALEKIFPGYNLGR